MPTDALEHELRHLISLWRAEAQKLATRDTYQQGAGAMAKQCADHLEAVLHRATPSHQ